MARGGVGEHGLLHLGRDVDAQPRGWPAVWALGLASGRAGGGGVSGCVRSHGQGEGSQGAGQGWYCHVPSIHAPELGPDDPWFPLCLGVTFPGSGQGRSIRAQGPARSWEARLETGPMLAFQGWEADFSTGPRAMTVCPVQSGSA